ncbi:MAG: isochorismatase family protein [Vicinamibacterales bacterium]
MDFLHRESTALLVVDMQERLLGAFAEERRAGVVRYASICVDVALTMGIPIVITEQYPKGLGPTIREITDKVGAGVIPIEKIVFSCGRSPEFKAALAATGRRNLLICGVETHVCVLQTALDLGREGYRIHVPADAVMSRRDLDWRIGLDLMKESGATVGTTEIFAFQLLERAGTDEFKAISKLIR